MYPALIKHQIVKPSAFHITRLARASVSNKTHSSSKGNEEFFVTTTFPDDYESSLNSDILQEQSRAMKSQTTPDHFNAADIEQHKADIYESIVPQDSKAAMKKKNNQDLPEQEPSLDEM
ncbi:uncharacterized protein N7496_011420 [Penicillium cataractarum]|uniref:Uncharacterized protein n=1 Tax=Penicillium cataractarum TaxID=2100454 RepID=A0A9W9UVL0_9EURO|nr:uncharacterized protein N7496_011420 [Penicillium cataractarum]KAJ5359007.1 hypothetical protein N7496_011420 [Penicillium cataractarum]